MMLESKGLICFWLDLDCTQEIKLIINPTVLDIPDKKIQRNFRVEL